MKWKIVTIKSISKQIRGVSYTPKDVSSIPLEGHIRLLRANNITESGIDLSDTVFVNQKCISESQKLKVGDILIAASSGSIKIVGKAILIEDEINSSFGAFCKVIRPSENVDYRYLSYYFRSSDYRQKISHLAAGANINNLRNEDLDNLEIPLPPLPTQKRIAEILDAADALRRKDQELLRKYDELAQAIFIDMFGDPVKNEKGWEVGRIRDVAFEVKYGTSKPAEENGQYPYLRMNNITYEGNWDFRSLKYINLSEEELEKYIVRDGDLVFNRTNSKELVGKTAVFDFDKEMAIAGYLIRVRFNERANPYYISSYLNSKHGKKTLIGMCKSIVGMANINAQELQEIRIMIPPINLQNEYSKLFRKIQLSKSNVITQINNSNKLFEKILQQAFKGELVK